MVCVGKVQRGADRRRRGRERVREFGKATPTDPTSLTHACRVCTCVRPPAWSTESADVGDLANTRSDVASAAALREPCISHAGRARATLQRSV